VAKVAKRLEQVEASIARYLAALDHADRQRDDASEAKTTRIRQKIEGLRRQRRNAAQCRHPHYSGTAAVPQEDR
jgi:hypothetical protein